MNETTPKSEIVPGEVSGVTLIAAHSCGHRDKYYYAAEQFALADIPSMEGKPCLECRNIAELKLVDRVQS